MFEPGKVGQVFNGAARRTIDSIRMVCGPMSELCPQTQRHYYELVTSVPGHPATAHGMQSMLQGLLGGEAGHSTEATLGMCSTK